MIILMMLPRKNEFSLLDDIFDDPFFTRGDSKVMKTDIVEHKKSYDLKVDLPGFEKEDIKIDIEDGYLTINASQNKETKDEEDGKFVRRERYFGECSRSFYIGEGIEVEDIKASFKNGILKLEVPKKAETKEIPEKKYVQID